jgi:hypothetical protein
LVAGANDFCCWRIQVLNALAVTTVPWSRIAPCQMPHSSAQRTLKLSNFVGFTNTTLSTPGFASALTPSW